VPIVPGAPRIAVGGKAYPRLMGQCDDLESFSSAELQEEVNDQVTRYAEKVGDADLLEVGHHIVP
jgi:hypothetical protein